MPDGQRSVGTFFGNRSAGRYQSLLPSFNLASQMLVEPNSETLHQTCQHHLPHPSNLLWIQLPRQVPLPSCSHPTIPNGQPLPGPMSLQSNSCLGEGGTSPTQQCSLCCYSPSSQPAILQKSPVHQCTHGSHGNSLQPAELRISPIHQHGCYRYSWVSQATTGGPTNALTAVVASDY